MTLYSCAKCGKLYSEIPDRCSCSRVYAVGKRAGPFILEQQLDTNRWLACCILCGVAKEQWYTNLKRVMSCGCKPRHVEFKQIRKVKDPDLDNDYVFDYVCRRCGKSHSQPCPIVSYCCEEE